MADQKLSQLTELAVEPADVDEIYVSDGGTSKRITYGTLKTALLARANHTGTQTASTISDFDTEVSNNSDVAANTAKVTNATHTGDATGDGALTLQPAAITGKGAVTVAGSDLLLVADVSASPQVLGQVTASSVAALATPEGTAILSTGEVGGTKFLREDGDGTCSWQTVPAGTGDLKADGTVPLTADWDVGSFDITAAQFHSDIATGTAPFTVASTTLVSNLNADLLDGNEATAFATAAQGSTADSALQDVVDDLTPTLGGDLDANGQNVTNLGDVTFQTGAAGGTLRTGTSNADKFQLQAYDVNDATYRTLIEADAGNDVRLQIPADYLDLEDATDTTKIARFDISGVATGTTRTITMPDANVDLGAIATNTAKVTNATHSGDAVGDGALTLQPAAITGKGAVTVDGADLLLVTDVSASPQVLGQVTAQAIANLAPAVQGSAILSSDTSPLVTDGYVLTADGAGGAAWEAAAGGGAFTTDANGLISASSAPVLDAATGNEVAYTFNYTTNKATSGNDTGLLINQTDTASPGTSLLMDLQIGGASKFRVDNDGHAVLDGTNAVGGNVFDVRYAGTSKFSVAFNGTATAASQVIGTSFASSSAIGFFSINSDTILVRDGAAATLAQRNSTNAQTFRVYGTYTDASNYERLAITGSAVTVETAGTGTDDIDLTLTPAGAGVLKFGTHSALSGESVTGYITIKDAAGNSRKLAVVS